MAYSEQNITERNLTTDATFRLWVQGIQAALTAAGLTQTSDTGQINSASVTIPSTSTYAGYEIWRFNDSEQGSRPIFFKLEYGIAASAGRHALRWTVGTGSDGAGTISNADAAQAALSTATMSTGNCWVAASYFAGQFSLLDFSALSNSVLKLFIERGRNASDGSWADEILTYAVSGSGDFNSAGFRARKSGSWQSGGTLKFVEAVAVSGGEMFVGALRRSDRPARLLRSFMSVPSSLGVSDSGTVDDGDVSMTYRNPAAMLISMSWGTTSYSCAMRSA